MNRAQLTPSGWQPSRRTCLAGLTGWAGWAAAGGLGATAWPLQGLAQSTQESEASGQQRQRVRINFSLEPNSLDPTTTSAAANAQVAHYNLLEGLTQIQEDGSVRPLLAKRWQVSSDQRHWLFTLREGVRFHDGQLLDADCVIDSFRRAGQPDSGNKARHSFFANIAHLHSPQPQTVALQLHHPDPHLLFRLGESSAVVLHPSTRAQAERQPIGTGPYRLHHWQRSSRITLRKNPDYWGDAPFIEWVDFSFLQSAAQQVQALQRQQVDVVFQFFTDSTNQFRHNPVYQVLHGSSTGKGLLAFNHRLPLLQDVRVRRAISHAIDRERFITEVLVSQGTAIGSHMSPQEPGYIHLANTYPFDPELARQLLRQAGLGQQAITLRLAVPPAPYAVQGAPLIVHDLAQVGITVVPEFLSWPQWLQGPFTGDFELTLINHVEPLDYAIYGDPGYYFGYDNPALRQLLERHRQARSHRQQLQLLRQIQIFLAQEAVNAWIFNVHVGTVVNKGLQGVWVKYPIFAHNVAAMRWV